MSETPPPIPMTVSTLLDAALSLASIGEADVKRRWTALSHRMAGAYGGRASLTSHADGRTDLLIRAMEAEAVRNLREDAAPQTAFDFSADLQVALSRYWVLSTYEVLRIMKNTEAGRADERLKALCRRFELVRIPIAKLEIPKERLLRDGVLWLGRQGDGPDDPPIPYRKGDAAFHPLTVVDTTTGSVGWHTIDLASGESGIIHRRDLSDRLLSLFDGIDEPSPPAS